MGWVLGLMAEFKEALQYYRRAVELAPGRIDTRLRYADQLTLANQFDAARIEFERAYKQAPDRPEVLTGYARCLAREPGQEDRAEEMLRRSLALKPDQVEALFELGQLRYSRNDFAEAKRLLGRARELDPTDAEIVKILGNCIRKESGWTDESAAITCGV